METDPTAREMARELQQMITRGVRFSVVSNKRYEDENEEQFLLYEQVQKEIIYARRHLAEARDILNRIDNWEALKLEV